MKFLVILVDDFLREYENLSMILAKIQIFEYSNLIFDWIFSKNFSKCSISLSGFDFSAIHFSILAIAISFAP